jgi:hypothetical protein
MNTQVYKKSLLYYLNNVDSEKFTASANGLCIVISKFTKKQYLSYNKLIIDYPELKADKKFLGLRSHEGYKARTKILEKAIKKLEPKWVNLF